LAKGGWGDFLAQEDLLKTGRYGDVEHQSGNLFSGEFQKVGGAGDAGIITANQLLALHRHLLVVQMENAW
jgi:hypothetical protein